MFCETVYALLNLAIHTLSTVSVVGVATLATAWAIRDSYPGNGKGFFFSRPTNHSVHWAPGLLSPGFRGPGGTELNHSSPSEITNEWSYTSAPTICLNGVER